MSDIFRINDTGVGVETAQRLLNFHLSLPKFPPLTDFGTFDAETQKRVKIYQRMAALSDDGEIGPLTTKALMPVGKLTLDGNVVENSLLPPVPRLRLDPSLREMPKFGPTIPAPTLGPPVAPYIPAPDWLFRSRPLTLHLDNVQLSAGNETDLPKGSDSAPMQFAVEFIYLKKRDGNPVFSHGFQLSYTPKSDDGRWGGQVYGKVGMSDWPFDAMGPISLANPFVQLYVKKALDRGSPWTVGAAIGNETDVTILKKEGSYQLQAYLNLVPLQLDFFDINDHSVSLKAASTIGLGFKMTWFTPEWKGPAPGFSP